MAGRPAPTATASASSAAPHNPVPARLRRERRKRAEARLRLQLVRDGVALAGHRGGPVENLTSSNAGVLAEIAAIRTTVAHLVARLDALIGSSGGMSAGTVLSPRPCGPPREDVVPVVVQGGGAALSAAPHLGLSAGQGGQGRGAAGTETGDSGIANAAVAALPDAVAAHVAKRAKISIVDASNVTSQWEVLPFRDRQRVHAVPSLTSAPGRMLEIGEFLSGVLQAPDVAGVEWLRLAGGQGYVAAAVAEQRLPGMPVFLAQLRLRRRCSSGRGVRALSGDS